MMESIFFARIRDLLVLAERGEIAVSDFLNPEEQYHAKQYLAQCQISNYCLFGGYADAERKRLFCLPDWCFAENQAEPPDGWEMEIAVLHIQGSGYHTLTHRDYLGSLLALGVARQAVGDLVPQDEQSCVCFCAESIAPFLLEQWERVGSDKVHVSRKQLSSDFTAHRNYRELRDTIASARLDCAVASVTQLSREKAKALITSGKVRLNFTEVFAPDAQIAPGDQLSVTGTGRFVIRDCEEYTKKNRIRFCAWQYL